MNAFKTSPNGRKFIELWEGSAMRAYDDGTGTWTIGYGHTSAAGLPKVHPGMVITAEEADTILASDLASVEADVNHHVLVTINQNQYDALVSFDFNVGALDRSNVLRAINTSRFDLVAGDLNMWSYGGGRFMPGLLKRRKAEYVLFTTGGIVGP